jgi:pimeloyl-ACP methyl ester carboxylesterase
VPIPKKPSSSTSKASLSILCHLLSLIYYPGIGNVGSPLHRLPLFRKLLLHPLLQRSTPHSPAIDLEIIAIPPRSYGLSTNSGPSESRLLKDYTAICEYATARAEQVAPGLPGHRVPVLFMGHSLGASIAVVLLSRIPANLSSSDNPVTSPATQRIALQPRVRCDGLIFENGFASIPEMVKALYPHKWLPYHHLGSFAYDRWDALSAFEGPMESATSTPVAEDDNCDVTGTSRKLFTSPSLLHNIPILFISSEKDEMVPSSMMHQLYDAAKEKRSMVQPGAAGQVRWLEVKDALHDFAWQKEIWARNIVKFVEDVAANGRKW